jgi:3-phenylpropionate/cinnamic acid dioxygenase small subunit
MATTEHERTVAALADRWDIEEVGVRYATALDTRDWALLATCFTEDALGEYDGIGRLEGATAFVDTCRGALTPLAASHHLLGNFTCRPKGDEASAAWYFQAQHVRTGTPGGDDYIVAGTYRDRLVRTAAGWRIAERTLSVTWTSGNPEVLKV